MVQQQVGVFGLRVPCVFAVVERKITIVLGGLGPQKRHTQVPLHRGHIFATKRSVDLSEPAIRLDVNETISTN